MIPQRGQRERDKPSVDAHLDSVVIGTAAVTGVAADVGADDVATGVSLTVGTDIGSGVGATELAPEALRPTGMAGNAALVGSSGTDRASPRRRCTAECAALPPSFLQASSAQRSTQIVGPAAFPTHRRSCQCAGRIRRTAGTTGQRSRQPARTVGA